MLSEHSKPKNGFSCFYLGNNLSISLSRSFFLTLYKRKPFQIPSQEIERKSEKPGKHRLLGREQDTERLFINLESHGMVRLKNVSMFILFIRRDQVVQKQVWTGDHSIQLELAWLFFAKISGTTITFLSCQDNYKS